VGVKIETPNHQAWLRSASTTYAPNVKVNIKDHIISDYCKTLPPNLIPREAGHRGGRRRGGGSRQRRWCGSRRPPIDRRPIGPRTRRLSAPGMEECSGQDDGMVAEVKSWAFTTMVGENVRKREFVRYARLQVFRRWWFESLATTIGVEYMHICSRI